MFQCLQGPFFPENIMLLAPVLRESFGFSEIRAVLSCTAVGVSTSPSNTLTLQVESVSVLPPQEGLSSYRS